MYKERKVVVNKRLFISVLHKLQIKTLRSSVNEDMEHVQCKSHFPKFVATTSNGEGVQIDCTLMNKLFIYNYVPLFLFFAISTNNKFVL